MIEELTKEILNNMSDEELKSLTELIFNDERLKVKILEGVENEDFDSDFIDCDN